MSFDALLDLLESEESKGSESHVSTETSDNEIFQAVIDLIAARENLEDIPVEPLLTRRDVLMAVSTIKRYTEDMDDPFSRKVDTILGSFNRQLHLDEISQFFPFLEGRSKGIYPIRHTLASPPNRMG
ncbi:hypothetical protein BDQ17DRAFT_1364477 [Cyathus striatus]|nr:hypothetical protein BDQ17DRAFT_1364477 [Cyathus striatus]